MSAGDLIWYEDIDGGLVGLVLRKEINENNEFVWIVRWSDHSISHEDIGEIKSGKIRIIQ